LGLELVLDSTTAVDSAGRPLPDLRLGTDFTAPPEVVRLVVSNPSTVWAVAGLLSGDELLAVNGVQITSRGQLRSVLGRLSVGDKAAVEFRRNGAPLRLTVPVASYQVPRASFVDAPAVTPGQRVNRANWMAGK
jgi:S1-C subfamily serine protease